MSNGKVHENRIRRMAERQLLRLEKSRRRDPHAVGYGLYSLVTDLNIALAVDVTLDVIETILKDPTRPRYQKAADGQYRWQIPASPAASSPEPPSDKVKPPAKRKGSLG